MSSRKERPRKLRGFAGVLYKQLDPLNQIDYFKEKHKDTNVKLLLNTIDGKHAALITIDKGTISVDSFPNKNKKDLKKKVLGWKGKLEADTKTFLDIAMGKLPIGTLAKKLFTGKLRGPRKLLIMASLFNILEKEKNK